MDVHSRNREAQANRRILIRRKLGEAHSILQECQHIVYMTPGTFPLWRRLALNRAQDTVLRLILWLEHR